MPLKPTSKITVVATTEPAQLRGSDTAGRSGAAAWDAFVGEMVKAIRVREIAQLGVDFCRSQFAATTCRFIWTAPGLGPPGGALSAFPDLPVSVEDEALALRALSENRMCRSADPAPGRVRIAVPLPVGNGAFAVLSGDFDNAVLEQVEPRESFARYQRLLANKLSGALTVERLLLSVERLERAEKLQRALYAISDQASSDQDMSEVLGNLHEIVGHLMYAENFYIVLHNAKQQTVRFIYFEDVADPDRPDPNEDIPLERMSHSLTWHLILRGEPLMGPPSLIEEVLEGGVADFGPDCVDWLGVPLLDGSDVRGALVVQSYTESARYTEADKTLLTFVAKHILTALERKQAHEELERRVAERTDALRDANRVLSLEVLERQRGERLQAALFRIAELGNISGSLEEFYAAVHRVVGGLLYARNFYIALLSEDHSQLHFPYAVDEKDPTFVPRKLGKGLTEYVLNRGTALLVDRAEIERLHDAGEVHSFGTRSASWLGVPLICAERPVGVLVVQSYSDEHRYSGRDQELLMFVSYHIANGLERKRSSESLLAAYTELERRVAERTEELVTANSDLREQIGVRERFERQLKHEALHDALTGLPNRVFLLDRLTKALTRFARNHQRRFAVLFLDLDRFKVINDSMGHLVGDEILKEAGVRIGQCLRGHDVVARMGGDEFAILLDDIDADGDACEVARRVILALNEPIRVGAKELFTSTSIGIAVSHIRYGKPEELLRDADVALYRAKANGRRRFELFDEGLHQAALKLLDLEGDLRRALARREFEPYFQAIVTLNDATVVGYETLLRWRHPERGILCPGEFLAVAEENGSSEAIDWQIFEMACTHVGRLTARGGFVSVNLSPRHFRSPQLPEQFLALLERHNVAPERIRLEVTEGALLENPAQVQDMLADLRQAGVLITLDDFGTGYSSLSYLHQFPLHALKIDRSFVADLRPGHGSGGAAVVRAIRALASSLGMQVIAEGIETEVQRSALMELGCELGQGFLFALPLAPDEIPESAISAK